MKFFLRAAADQKSMRVVSFLVRSGWKISSKITGAAIKNIFFHPQKYTLSAHEKDLLRSARDFWFTVHKKRIKAYVWGEGPGVLLVHGWNGCGIQFHRFIPSLLEKGYSAIAIDGPAHGQSEGRHTSYFEFSDTVRAFMTSPHGRRTKGIIGHSLGAAAAVNCQSKDVHPVKLVLLAPAVHLQAALQQNLLRLGLTERIFDRLLNEYEKHYGYSITKDEPIHLLNTIQSDILIVHDRKDRMTPYKDIEEAAVTNPHIEFFATEGLGHFRLLTADNIVTLVIDFLK